MHSGRFAHRILLLVVADDRATAITGDLIESAGSRHPARFWASLIRIVTAIVFQDVRQAPLRFAAFLPISWFAYMFVTVLLIAVGRTSTELLWTIARLLSNHTGVELLTDWLHNAIDGPTPPLLMRVVELVMVAIAAPFLTGRWVARWWSRRELAAAVVMALSWPLMAATIPMVGDRAAATMDVVPVMLVCMSVGTIWVRLRQPSHLV